MKSLKFKLLLGFAIPIMVTFSLLIIVVNDQIKDVNIPLTEDLSQQIIEAKAEKIGTWLYQRVGELKVLSENSLVMSMDMESIKPYMREFEKSHLNEFESFGLSDLTGSKWVSQDVYIDVSERIYYQRMLDGDQMFCISNPIESKSNGEPIVVIIHKIIDSNGECVGFVDGAVKLSKLTEIASEVQMHDGVGWLSDRNGLIFTGFNGPDLVEETLLDQGFTHTEGAERAIRRGEAGIHAITKADGTIARMINSPIPYTPSWSLGIIISESLIYEDTDNLLFVIISFGLIMLLICLVMALIFSNRLSKPARELKELMKQAEEGDLTVRYNGPITDEIGQIGSSFNSMIVQIDTLMDTIYEEQKAKRKAELLALQAQIKPHFLYNTLDTIKWMALEHDAVDVAKMTKALTRLFQISLSNGHEIIPLAKEIEHIKQYLYIQKVRYEEKLAYDIHCEEKLRSQPITKLILQPIVENAIYHGIKPKDGPGHIQIDCRIEDDLLVLEVADDGIGFDGDYSKTTKDGGYGLVNVQERIRLLYGESYGIELTSEINVGTVVKVRLPLMKDGERDV